MTYWRRLAASDRPNRIFHAVKAVVARTGALAGTMHRALDSTVLDDAVATQAVVLCADEKSRIQALDPDRPCAAAPSRARTNT